jgi:hypothetical protein
LLFITEIETVYCEVQGKPLNKRDCLSSFKRFKNISHISSIGKEALFLEVKQTKPEAGKHLPPASARIRNAWKNAFFPNFLLSVAKLVSEKTVLKQILQNRNENNSGT